MRRLLRFMMWGGLAVAMAMSLLLAGVVISIRSGLQHDCDQAVARFPGDRVEALIQVVDCESCAFRDRNRAVWALGQMREERAIPVLRKYFDGERCTHSTRLCQKELRKAIHWIESPAMRSGVVPSLLSKWHQPWR